jgi:nitroimidazol reductase NimA-like FMN-containing flavoprotein (pyridoxamine 5'-phosphate oxidase superfamily)
MLGELSTGQIEDLLRNEVLARLGFISGGRAYVVPVT